MRRVTLVCAPHYRSAREAAIHVHVRDSLAACAELDEVVEMPRALPGLRKVGPEHAVVALGRDAHVTCADFEKATLVADTVANAEPALPLDMTALIWSSLHTRQLVALGNAAWRTSQLWPVMTRRREAVPPIRLPRSGSALDVLIIDHDDDGRIALEIVAGFIARNIPARIAQGDFAWQDLAAVHVHVGRHGRDSERIRLLDSWCSNKLVLHLVPHWRTAARDADDLEVDAEINGFSCRTLSAVFDCYDDLCDDPVLRRKMLDAGVRTAAPAEREWRRIAADLLA